MPLINIAVRHGQTREVARANFQHAVDEAGTKFATYIHRVEWSPDRSSATLSGTGFELKLWVDDHDVHATGDIPIFARFLEGPLTRFLQETFRKQITR